jgi:hypothetical protein
MSSSRCCLPWGTPWPTSGRAHECVKRVAKHTNTPETIDFSSSFAPLPLAVDAATMLEVFHNYAYQLYLIGKRQSQGSQRQKALFTLAKWLFDRGDSAKLSLAVSRSALSSHCQLKQTSS